MSENSAIFTKAINLYGGRRDLITQFPEYPRRSVYWHANLPIEKSTVDKRKQNKGKPRIISERSVRHIENTLKEWRRNRGVFCSHDMQQLPGVSETDVSNRTVRSCLNDKNYQYLQCRKKGPYTCVIRPQHSALHR